MSNNARFIWNCRYFHIAKDSEALSNYAVSGSYVKALVEYVGTRESVVLNIDKKYINDPATDKQKELINNLEAELKRMVSNENKDTYDYKDSFEYNDYTEAPTKGNASELIAYLTEQIEMNDYFGKAENLIEYAAKRPSAVIEGEHGLFSSTENIDLKMVQDEIANHKGNVWTHILSLRREDADALGYTSQKPWRDLIMANLDNIAKAHKIKVSNLRWYAAVHNTGHHPHIHLFVYSVDPKEGYFSEKNLGSISFCKSKFANMIFAEEMLEDKKLKTMYRDELKLQAKQTLASLLVNPIESFSAGSQKSLINKFLELSEKIPDDKINKEIKYGDLKENDEIKLLVDSIQKQLVYDNPLLSELYDSWCEHQKNIEKIYLKDPKDKPIENNLEFRPIQNEIIRLAQKLKAENNVEKIAAFSESLEDIEKDERYFTKYPDEIKEQEQKADDISDKDTVKHTQEIQKETFEALNFKASDINMRDGDVCCKLADCYMYGEGTQQNTAKAMLWYGISADQYHNGIAAYRLAKIYTQGSNEIEKNTDLGENYFRQAYYELRESIKNWEYFLALHDNKYTEEYFIHSNSIQAYKEYMIGYMYYNGDGVEQDYTKAFKAFWVAAQNGNTNAQFHIAKQLLSGEGVNENKEKAIECLENATLFGNSYSAYALHKLHEETNPEKSKLYLEISAELDNPFAQLKCAENKIDNGEIDEGIALLQKASTHNLPQAFYKLGEVYEKFINTDFYDKSKSEENYAKALKLYINQFDKTPDKNTAYRIGLMYNKGLGVDRDIDKAIEWYKKSLELGNINAQQAIENAEQQQSTSLMAIASTACHFGKILQSDLNAPKQRFSSDKKLLRQEKIQKINAGHAVDETAQAYDY